jgi:hypothetical protein
VHLDENVKGTSLGDSGLTEASICRPAFPVCAAWKRCKAGTLRLLCSALVIGTLEGAANDPPPDASFHSIDIPALSELRASGSPPLDQPLTQPSLDRQIERVLENPEFNWREPTSTDHRSNRKSLLDQLISWMREAFNSVGRTLNQLWVSLLRVFDFKRPVVEPPTSGWQLPSGIISTLTYLLWAALAVSLILFTIRLRKLRATVRSEQVLTPPRPDLADERIAANQLPEDEWAALARQKIAAGEFRQALRALFLAILALLASHRFIAVDRWKSNSDYEKELSRKAKPRSDLLALFALSRLRFERCWYGADSVTPADLESYHGIYERIKHAAADNL